MNRLAILVAISLALAVIAACEPQNVAIAPTSPPTSPPSVAAAIAPSDSGGASPGTIGSAGGPTATHALGDSTFTNTPDGVQVAGHGPVLQTPVFPLPGNVAMSLSTCGSTTTYPFIWLYTKFNGEIGQYVEQINHIKLAKGDYYMHVVSPPDCEWQVTFASE